MRYAIDAAFQPPGGEQRQYLVTKLLDEFAIPFPPGKWAMRREFDRAPAAGNGRIGFAGYRMQSGKIEDCACEFTGGVESIATVSLHFGVTARPQLAQ